jgi:hypothetical protein
MTGDSMEFIADAWLVWLLLFGAATINRQFTIHEGRSKVRISLIRWYLTQGSFWGSGGLAIFSLLLKAIQFAKS